MTTTPGDPGTLLQHIDSSAGCSTSASLTAVNEQVVTLTGPTSGLLTNRTVYTAANGDQLIADFTGVAEFDFAANTATFSGTETYAGGNRSIRRCIR